MLCWVSRNRNDFLGGLWLKFLLLWFLVYERKQGFFFCVFRLEPFFLGLLVVVFKFYFWSFGGVELNVFLGFLGLISMGF